MIALLALIAQPDALVLALLTGILLIYVECNRPGSILPGCAGTLLVLLSLHRLAQDRLGRGAIVLCLAGAALILVEAFWPARRLFLLGGIAALTTGLWKVIEPFQNGHVHLMTAALAASVFGVTTWRLAEIALRARWNKRSMPGGETAQARRGCTG